MIFPCGNHDAKQGAMNKWWKKKGTNHKSFEPPPYLIGPVPPMWMWLGVLLPEIIKYNKSLRETHDGNGRSGIALSEAAPGKLEPVTMMQCWVYRWIRAAHSVVVRLLLQESSLGSSMSHNSVGINMDWQIRICLTMSGYLRRFRHYCSWSSFGRKHPPS